MHYVRDGTRPVVARAVPTKQKASAVAKGSPDVQAQAANRPYRLTRVGVKGVKKPVTVHRPGHPPQGVVATFDLFVDLPPSQKGTHMSRNLEALADILDEETQGREDAGLEHLCSRLALRLLERHDYAGQAHVAAKADFFLGRKNPGGKRSVEAYGVLAEAEAQRGAGKAPTVMRRIGVEVVGMTACPCAMETVRHRLGKKAPVGVPVMTHNQRNRVTLKVEVPRGGDVEASDLVDVCEAALSAPTFELLKRGDEGDLVMQAHANPRFVEDVVREVLHRVRDRYRHLGAAAAVFVSSEAEESIHKHNVYAERLAALGELG
ncbi:MAG: GTP cyclohydrolase MptA [Thermoplasmatota archaeon]|nr:GTP cyclohydrolase MptA [Halobacteriales archaeon]